MISYHQSPYLLIIITVNFNPPLLRLPALRLWLSRLHNAFLLLTQQLAQILFKLLVPSLSALDLVLIPHSKTSRQTYQDGSSTHQ